MVLGILLTIVGLIVDLGLGLVIAKSRHDKAIDGAKISASSTLENVRKESEALKKEALLEVKEENQEYRSEIESELKGGRLELKSQENRLIQREQTLDRKDGSLEKHEGSLGEREEKLGARQQLIDEREKEVENLVSQQHQESERIASLSKEEAKSVIMKSTEEESSHELTLMVKESEQRAKEESDRRAKNLLSLAIQRCAADSISETAVSVVTLPSDKMESRITDREGRNIHTLRTLTGIDLIIDDTPKAVVLSGLDPVRREIARMALEKLTQDDRIRPAHIEETVKKSRKEMDERIHEYGEQAVFEVGAHTLYPDLIKILGRLRFRTGYGQDVLNHSVEVTKLAGVLTAELGEDVQLTKRAGLLHGIGGTLDHEIEGSHVEIGTELAAKYKEDSVVINVITSHHGSMEATSVISVLVAAADALSAVRPDARSESLENYIRRLENLEDISDSFEDADSSFVVQAGCEVRVMVRPEETSDLGSVRLVRDIQKKIEDDLDCPGHIKVTVICETRAIDYAK